MRKVLVVGGAGYVGSVLVRLLLKNGYAVKVLDNLIYNNEASISALFEEKDFEFINGDFTKEDVVENALEGVTDVVLLAALVGDPICKKYQELAKRTNLDGPKQLFQKMKGRGINSFVFTSTCSNYGLRENDEPASEDSDLNPVSLYAETKVAFEKFILENGGDIDFCPTILRIATAFGGSSRMRFDLTVSEFTRELALGKDLLVYDEDTWRPYCHIADLSRAVIRVLESDESLVRNEVFNVGSTSENYTKKMIVDEISKHIGVNVSYKEGGFDPRNYRVSFDKISDKLNFNIEYPVSAAIPGLIQAVQSGLFDDVEERKGFYGNYQIEEQ